MKPWSVESVRILRRAVRLANAPVVLWGGHPDKTVQAGSDFDKIREAVRDGATPADVLRFVLGGRL